MRGRKKETRHRESRQRVKNAAATKGVQEVYERERDTREQ
jgi:hypothetical protein